LQDIVNIILFNVVPQMIDIVVACSYLATKMQPWVAGIVLVTVSSYVPVTVCITERRGKVGLGHSTCCPVQLTASSWLLCL
jgi:ATP-binding cassette subfamily B (MDR/TAP) protein 6